MGDEQHVGGGEDFPAAHSMDTEWFAVDADGRVAMLDSGEAGNVSDAFLSDRSGEESTWDERLEAAIEQTRDEPLTAYFDDIAAAGPRRGSLSALQDDGVTLTVNVEALRSQQWAVELLLWLDDGGSAAVADVDAGQLRCTAGGELAFVPEIDGAAAARLVERLRGAGTLRAAFYGDVLIPPPRLGLYSYDCDTYGDDPPYDREAVPLLDVYVSDLPPALRTPAARTRLLRLRFGEAVRLRVTKHISCSGWGVDGQGPLPLRAPTGGIVELDAAGTALLRAALIEEEQRRDERGARAVLADWLQDRQHPLGEVLARAEPPLFPAALDLLPLPLQQRLACELVEQVLPLLARADDELLSGSDEALDLARRFMAGRLPAHGVASEAEGLIGFGCWLGLLSPTPWARDVAEEASWLAAYARAREAGGWPRARDEARRAQLPLVADLLGGGR